MLQMNTEFPPTLTPINLHAYFYNAFGCCGCTEMHEVHNTVLKLLEWHANNLTGRCKFQQLYPEPGVFYLLSGWFELLGLTDHGVSIRCGWITPRGQLLLDALKQYTSDEIDNAEGEAYDGCHYNL